MAEWLTLIIAAFLAGIINSIAGGGSFLTFPALVFAGVPPVAANATSAVAVFPGYLGGVAGFRHELTQLERRLVLRYLVVSLAGGSVGSLLLLVTTDALFSTLVPWLLLFATLLFAAGESILTNLKGRAGGLKALELPLLFLVSLYGGYFNGGLGIILLALLLFIGLSDLNLMNGLKNGISFSISSISVVIFSLAGLVHWLEASVMMVAATLGGYYGAVVARKIPAGFLKCLISAIGFTMALVFFLRR